MKSPLILVIEDEVAIGNLFTSYLEGAGYGVFQAASGMEAVQAARIQRPDLVISDVSMPGMDAYELTRRLRQEPLFSAIPIILISGVFNDAAGIGLARSFGVRHFLSKPLSKETLLASVADALRFQVAPPFAPNEQLEREHNRVLIDKLTEKVAALAASEERFRQMAESIGDVFWLADRTETQMFYVSPAYERIWGRSCESLYASPRSWTDAIHPEDRLRILAVETRELAAAGQEHTYRIVRPDGTIRWIHNRAFPVLDESGQIIRVTGVAKDVTKEKQAEEELRISQHRFATLFRASPIAIAFGLGVGGRIMDVNDKYAKMFGYRREEMLGRTVAELNLWSNIQDRDKLMPLFQTGGKLENVEARFRRKSGEEFVALFSMEQMPSGDEALAVAMLIDVTDWKAAQNEAAVRARQQAAVAELGQRALAKVPWTTLFNEAVVLVARTLEVEFSKVLELRRDEPGLKLVAGVGLHEGLVGQTVAGVGADSLAGFTLQCETPVILEDMIQETRFRSSPLLRDHGVVSGVSVIIGSLASPWGLLGAYTSHKRTFTNDDVNFVRAVANVLGAAVARDKAEQSLVELSGRLMHVEDTERRRIAKELHDSTAQDLVAVMMNLESLREGVAERNPAEAKQLEDSIALVENAAHEIRTLSYILHPPRLDEAGLIGAIRHYAAGFGERTGIATRVDLPLNFERLGEAVEVVLFRVAQESLGNIHRHARSRTAFVFLKHDASGIVLEVRDEGRGIPPQILETKPGQFLGLGVGIPGMRERLRFIGGNLEIDSSSRGTIVRARVPSPLKTVGLNT